MKRVSLLLGGLVAGVVIVAGEAVLNLWLLFDDWSVLRSRQNLPQLGVFEIFQGTFKLLLLGVFTVGLALVFEKAFQSSGRARFAAGLVVWGLVWVWVQWGMWLAGYITPKVAFITVGWGLLELSLASWLGAAAYRFTSTTS